MSQPYRAGADIGGTFTDLIVVNTETGDFSIGKVSRLRMIRRERSKRD